jgi:adenylate cyclase
MSDPTKVSRRLVAVFAADVEGYSRLMGVDEVGTLKGLTERRAILDRFIGEHGGRIANTAGDSVLAEFGSAVDAVQCAVDAQAALAEANASLSADRHINFRIGIHVGDVMVRGGDLFGDGVNIAARLQALAQPGGVCLSGTTYEQVRKVLAVAFTDMGLQQVKNIEDPIRAYAARELAETIRSAAVAEDSLRPLPLPDKPSIAVLPFQNMSGDPEQEYFADGMVEEIITALSRFKGLFVIARNSSFTFKGKAVDVKEVGRRLGVRYVLEGSVRKASGKVRITGQLIDAVTGAHIWADRFERDLTDVFALQDEVTVAVVSAIQPKLLEAEIEMASRRPPENLTAYDLALRARKAWYLVTREGIAEAIQLAHRALNLDPRCILAAILAANAHRGNVALGFSINPQFERNEAIRLSRLALSLDGNDAGALGIAGWLTAVFIGDYETATDFAERAVASNPNDAGAWRQRGWVYKFAGQYEEAIQSFERGIRLDPLFPLLHNPLTGIGQSLIELRCFDEAIAVSKKALRHNSSDSSTYRALVSALAHLGRDAEARDAATRLLELDPGFTMTAWIARSGQSIQSNSKLLIEGLRKAGLPE